MVVPRVIHMQTLCGYDVVDIFIHVHLWATNYWVRYSSVVSWSVILYNTVAAPTYRLCVPIEF